MKVILLAVTVVTCFYTTCCINNGEKANATEFKYVVSIRFSTDFYSIVSSLLADYSNICTGGIIHDKFILTAATCFCRSRNSNPKLYKYIENNVMVYANTNVGHKPSKKTVIRRKGKIIHFIAEFFEIVDGPNIALLELKVGLGIDGDNRHILQKLKLPSFTKSDDNVLCVIAGFGFDKTQKKQDYRLKKLYVKILPNSYHRYSKENRNLIAIATDKNGNHPEYRLGTCIGDYGAPVVLVDSPSTIVGVVASVNRWCDGRMTNNPEVYVKLANHLTFIDDITSSNLNNELYKSYCL